MPIVQLQSEFIASPEYTWESKPPAAGNAGKEIIVTDFNRSRWYSDGTYWRPVGGVLSLPVDVSGVSTNNPLVFDIIVPNMPSMPIKEWLSTPRASIYTALRARRVNASNAQSVAIGIRVDTTSANLVYVNLTNTHPTIAVAGNMANASASDFIYTVNLEPSSGSSSTDSYDALSTLPSGLTKPVLAAQVGSTDTSETIQFTMLHFTLRM